MGIFHQLFHTFLTLQNLSLDEQYRTFNMGVGMALIVDMDDVDDVAEALSDQGFEPFVMGQIIPGTGKVVYNDAN